MKKLLLPSLFLTFCFVQFSAVAGYSQTDLFKGMFDKEDPVFHPTILADAEKGAVRLVYHFSHSKIDALEASVWIKDQGSNLMGEETKHLVRGLQEIGNRQQDTVRIKGLINNHFYTIGIDYRTLNNLSRKFSSTILQQGYRYTYTGPQDNPAQLIKEPEPEVSFKSVSPPVSRQEPLIGQQQQFSAEPCRNPDLTVGLEEEGYCNSGDRPAVLIRCNNCEGRNWKFSVETRKDNGYWEPIRVDGERQAAAGNVIRKEPLCVLPSGSFHVRVLAWGDQCQAPVIMNIPEKVNIAEPYDLSRNYTAKGATTQEFIPDTCEVSGDALLEGNIIRGYLKLDLNSPCANAYAYAKVTYVHPGYRDIPVEPVNLRAGENVEFTFYLDHKDLSRGIHTVQVATYIRSLNQTTPLLKSSFWIKADIREGGLSYIDKPDKFEGPVTNAGNDYVEFDDPPMIREQMDEVQVKAADPNCPQIQGLEMVFESGNLSNPLYISWLSPRCCQEEGCEYTIWAGKTPNQLRMMVKGNKPGAKIMEVLEELQPEDRYVELEVSTANGSRKAAYVIGEGPKYGIEEVFAYKDQFHQVENKPIKGTIERPVEPAPNAGSLADRAGGDPRVGGTQTSFSNLPVVATANPVAGGELAARAGTEVSFNQPTYPVSKFQPCKYKRDISIVGNQPLHSGDEITIKYNFSEEGYQYTLYQQPPGSSNWFVAHGTRDLQSSPNFFIQTKPYHSGKYLILAFKPEKNWGCLSNPVSQAFSIKVDP